ncbi:hypothetical protein Ddye_006109 [Dipteronia dyeriana]|uniref:J domain-containing protein n=1 Tax=Dipteronia dyeriana TaxID=168575 RepID=A0AAE0CQF3_9ROSI|nr:hypothetical protein Ddye_006109 [Dipteronia dyeriana]
MSSNLRTLCRPHTMLTSLISCRHQARSIVRVSFRNPSCKPRLSPSFGFRDLNRTQSWFRVNQRRTVVNASAEQRSPYETLVFSEHHIGTYTVINSPTKRANFNVKLEREADEEQIKTAYRRLAKFYHPDVYDGRGTLEEGETAEARFIKIQAAYELLIDEERRRKYDMENRVNPMKASQAWTEWLMKKQKAFDQRGDMAIAAWAEQQQLELNLRARRLSRSKVLECFEYVSTDLMNAHHVLSGHIEILVSSGSSLILVFNIFPLLKILGTLNALSLTVNDIAKLVLI